MNLKEFYQIAKTELEQLYDDEPLDLRLEQVERSKGSGYWEVVVSYLVENKNRSDVALGPLISSKYERVYKSLEIDDNKQVVGFYMFSSAT